MRTDPAITIYHNPLCGTSRQTLALIRAAGIEPRVIEYLQHPPDEPTLRSLIVRSGGTARELLRSKEALCAQLGLLDPTVGEEALIRQMLAHPILINRPLVVTEQAVRLCRPAERVLDLLPSGRAAG